VILNQDGEGEGRIDLGEKLREFKDFTTGFPPDVRFPYITLPSSLSFRKC
jgi:hypothetical protein